MRKIKVALRTNGIDDNVPIEVDVSGRKAIIIRQATPQEYNDSMQQFRKELFAGRNKYVFSRYIQRISTPRLSARRRFGRTVRTTK